MVRSILYCSHGSEVSPSAQVSDCLFKQMDHGVQSNLLVVFTEKKFTFRTQQRKVTESGCGETQDLLEKQRYSFLVLISITKLNKSTGNTMLTIIQLIFLVFLTNSNHAEKLFHNRDHSDVQVPKSHQAPVITDRYEAEVKLVSLSNFSGN